MSEQWKPSQMKVAPSKAIRNRMKNYIKSVKQSPMFGVFLCFVQNVSHNQPLPLSSTSSVSTTKMLIWRLEQQWLSYFICRRLLIVLITSRPSYKRFLRFKALHTKLLSWLWSNLRLLLRKMVKETTLHQAKLT